MNHKLTSSIGNSDVRVDSLHEVNIWTSDMFINIIAEDSTEGGDFTTAPFKLLLRGHGIGQLITNIQPIVGIYRRLFNLFNF